MFNKIILFLALSLVHQITSNSIKRSDYYDAESKNASTFINEADDWLKKVLPNECHFDVDHPPKEIVECINNSLTWLNQDSHKSECCFKWGVVNCWFGYVKEKCTQSYDQTIKNAFNHASDMENCKTNEFEFNMSCTRGNGGISPDWIIIIWIVGSLVVIGIILTCFCCFCTTLCSCITCCLC